MASKKLIFIVIIEQESNITVVVGGGGCERKKIETDLIVRKISKRNENRRGKNSISSRREVLK